MHQIRNRDINAQIQNRFQDIKKNYILQKSANSIKVHHKK